MKSNKFFESFLFCLIAAVIVLGCQPKTKPAIQKVVKDSVLTYAPLVYHEFTEKEAKLIKSISQSKDNRTLLFLENENEISLAFFPDTEYALELADTMDHIQIFPVEKVKTFYDFDKDGVNEMILKYYTGGSHCCFESYIFKKIGNNKFKEIFFYDGEYGYITPINDYIEILVGGKFGYFYTSFTCDIGESLLGESINPKAILKYSNGRFEASTATDENRNKKLISYLDKLSKRPVPPLSKDLNYDDGTRKLYALLIMEYYFNNKCDIEKCESLFFKYYKANDSKNIWIEIKNSIEHYFGMELTDFPIKQWLH